MDLQRIEDTINNAIHNGSCPGIVVLLSMNGEVIYHKAFGYRGTDHREKATAETLYDLASLTKQLATTTAIMALIAKGMIKLDDKASQYLPAFGNEGKKSISISDLLSNSSGLAAYRSYYNYLKQPLAPSEAKKFFYTLLCDEKLDYEPGTKSVYSDLGFMVLGFLVEKVSSMNLDEFCQKYIFQPLHLKNTLFNDLSNKERSIATVNTYTFAPTENCPWRGKVLCGEVHDDNAYAMGGVAGHAGLFSTASDIHTLVKTVYTSYSSDQPYNFLPSHVIKTFFTKQNIPGSTWCLGWDTPSLQGSSAGHHFSENSIGHTGFTGTSLWIDLTRNLWVILLSNRVHPTRQNSKFKSLRPQLHDLLVPWAIKMMRN
ncbi:MAG: serine hydrolase domain-containing protein [bacterium]